MAEEKQEQPANQEGSNQNPEGLPPMYEGRTLQPGEQGGVSTPEDREKTTEISEQVPLEQSESQK